MIELPHLKDATVRVVGLGGGGRATVAALRASGAKVSVWDDDQERRDAVDAPSKGPKASLDGTDLVVLGDGGVSGGAKAIVPRARSAKIRVATELDLFTDALTALPEEERPRVVGVTGPVGKSVTAALIAHVVDAARGGAHVAGGAGLPCLALPKADGDATYVIELPIGRLAATTRFRCDVSVALGLGVAREDDGLDAALRAVMRLLRHHAEDEATVIGVDDGVGQKVCTALQSGDQARVGRAKVIPVSGEAALGHGVFSLAGQAYSSQDGRTLSLGDFSRAAALTGTHMNQDAAAAIAACLALDVPPQMIVKALHAYKGLSGRFEPIGGRGQVLFVDDSRARFARSVEMAIASCPDVFWIGTGERDAHAPNLKGVDTLRGVYLVGGEGEPDMAVASRHETLEGAFIAALRDAEAMVGRDPARSPVVLYSPGAPVDPAAFRALAATRIDEKASNRV